MMLARRLAILVVTILATLATGCGWIAKSAQGENRPKVNRRILENGLVLNVQEDHTIALVTMDAWVRVGSGDEPPERAGISHFLEHMLFKGTAKLAVGEYDRRIEGVGGYLNAATSTDYTHYYVTIPSEHFESALADFADVLQNSVMDQAEVDSERQVILEEIQRKTDSPFGYLMDEALPSVYSSGPYTHPVIGFPETVKATGRAELLDHYRRFYTGNNMSINIVGDVNAAYAFELASREFAGLRKEREPYAAPPETKFASPVRRNYPRDWNEAYFVLSFPVEHGAADIDRMAMYDLTETLLAGGRSSRLVNRIVEKKRLASNIGTYFPAKTSATAVMIYGTCEPEKLDEVVREVFAELAALEDKGIGGSEWKKVHRQSRNGHLFSLETGAGRASTLGYSEALLGNDSLFAGYEKALDKVEKKEAIEFARKYLRQSESSLFVTARSDRLEFR